MSAPTFAEDPVTQRPALQRLVALLCVSNISSQRNSADIAMRSSADFRLTVRQNPERARVAGGKEKGNCTISHI